MKIHTDRTVRLRIILLQSLAYVGRRNANYRVLSCVIRRVPPKERHPKVALFQFVSLSSQRLFNNVLQKLLASPAPFEGGAFKQIAKMFAER
jgi:hypothetical protein